MKTTMNALNDETRQAIQIENDNAAAAEDTTFETTWTHWTDDGDLDGDLDETGEDIWYPY